MKWICLFIFLPFIAQAQMVTITGTVKSIDEKPIDFYDVILMSEDSIIIESNTFLAPNFTLEGAVKENSLVQINAFGYAGYFKKLDGYTQNSINLGQIVLEPLAFTLNEAVVKAKRKKPIENINGNIVINVANSMLENENSVTDILKKSPGLILDQNGGVRVIGKGNNAPLVVIDGIESNMQTLNNLHPSQIQNIEIIKNPSAEYSANANSVINVTTNNSIYNGWNLKVAGQITKATYWRYYAGIDLGYNAEKFGFNLYYGYNPNIIRNTDNYNRFFNSSNTLLKNLVEVDYKNPHAHYINGDFKYDISKKSNLKFSINNSIQKGSNNTDNVIEVLQDSIFINKITTDITEQTFSVNNTNTLNFLHKIDTNGLNFRANASYSFYNNTSVSKINQDSVLLNANSGSKSNLFAIQPSLEVPFNKIKLNTTYGLRYSNIGVNGNNTLVDGITDNSKINENVFAAFAQANKQINKLNINAGLRYEYAFTNGVQNDTTELFNYNTSNIFPSASLSYELSKNWNVYTSYSYKIDRPNFTSLTSFNTYLDSLSSYSGNARLVSEYSHLFDVGASFMKVASVDFSYSKTKNPIVWFIETEPNSLISSLVQKNFDYKNEISLSLTIPYQTSFWTTYNVFGYSHQEIELKSQNLYLNNNMFFMNLYHEFNYKKFISLSVNYQYLSKGMFDIYNFEAKHVVNLGLKSSLLKNRLNIYLNWNDILRTDIYNLSTQINDLNVSDLKFYDSPLLRLGFTFTLNNAFKKIDEAEKNQEELNRLKKDN